MSFPDSDGLTAALALLMLGLVAYLVSTLGAGGGAILVLPVAGGWLDPRQIPPVIAVASVVSSVQRIGLYRSDIVRPIFLANVPGLLLGAAAGAWLLRGFDATLAGLAIGGFLVLYAAGQLLDVGVRLPPARPVHFGLASFATALLSATVGAAGPLMNPVYLQADVLKERMIGTKAASTLFMQVAKLLSFAAVGLLGVEVWGLGLALGVGALAGNVLGKRALGRLSTPRFRQAVAWVLLVSGLATLHRVWAG